MRIKSEKAITIIALVITIIVLLILAGVTINGTMTGIEETQRNKLLSELDIVQHAVLERYTKYSLTKDLELLTLNKEDVQIDGKPQIEGIEIEWQVESPTNDDEKYYKLTQDELKQLGIKDVKDTYIVNYKTGEVFNETVKKTDNGTILYKYAVDNNNKE